MDISSPSGNAVRLNALRHRLADAGRALTTLRSCFGDIQGAGACCAPPDFATVGEDLHSIEQRLFGEGDVVVGVWSRNLDRRTLAELPAEAVRQLMTMNARVGLLEARLARWLLLETRTTHHAVLLGSEMRNGTWWRIPADVDLTVELRETASGSGASPISPKLRLRLAGVECQVRHPGQESTAQAIRVACTVPNLECMEADPGEDSHSICGILRAIRCHGGLGWEGMLEMTLVTARLRGQGAEFVAVA